MKIRACKTRIAGILAIAFLVNSSAHAFEFSVELLNLPSESYAGQIHDIRIRLVYDWNSSWDACDYVYVEIREYDGSTTYDSLGSKAVPTGGGDSGRIDQEVSFSVNLNTAFWNEPHDFLGSFSPQFSQSS